MDARRRLSDVRRACEFAGGRWSPLPHLERRWPFSPLCPRLVVFPSGFTIASTATSARRNLHSHLQPRGQECINMSSSAKIIEPVRKLDIAWVREQFPALQRNVNGHPAVFFDAPGGTQVPQRVIDAISNYLSLFNANAGGAKDRKIVANSTNYALRYLRAARS